MNLIKSLALASTLTALVACGGKETEQPTPAPVAEGEKPGDPAAANPAAADPAAADPAAADGAPAQVAGNTGEASEAKKLDDAPKEYSEALKDPTKATEEAPATYKVRFDTTEGPFVVEVTREWAPKGADRLYNLVKAGFFEDIAFFRVIDGFMAQFGIHGDPTISKIWRDAKIDDDPGKQTNARGTLTFATAGPNTRTTQLFINFGDNARLDQMGFAPLGKIVEGLDVVDKIHKVGEGAPRGPGPDQGLVQAQGNAYLKQKYPDIDYITSARIEE